MAEKPPPPETTYVSSDWAAVADVHRFSHQAMATTFEVIIQLEDKTYAQQAARAAFDEVDRIEGELSRTLKRATSQNQPFGGRSAAADWSGHVRVPGSARRSAQTGGAFDVTVGSS